MSSQPILVVTCKDEFGNRNAVEFFDGKSNHLCRMTVNHDFASPRRYVCLEWLCGTEFLDFVLSEFDRFGLAATADFSAEDVLGGVSLCVELNGDKGGVVRKWRNPGSRAGFWKSCRCALAPLPTYGTLRSRYPEVVDEIARRPSMSALARLSDVGIAHATARCATSAARTIRQTTFVATVVLMCSTHCCASGTSSAAGTDQDG